MSMLLLADDGLLMQIGGPMWNGPLHNKEFVAEMLAHVAEHPKEFSTAARIEGMLTVAHNVSRNS